MLVLRSERKARLVGVWCGDEDGAGEAVAVRRDDTLSCEVGILDGAPLILLRGLQSKGEEGRQAIRMMKEYPHRTLNDWLPQLENQCLSVRRRARANQERNQSRHFDP